MIEAGYPREDMFGRLDKATTDRFCLDGQRLLLVEGIYGEDGAEYRTEIDGIARIYSYGTAGNGPSRFTVERKDGSTSQYGNTADSRIEARIPGDSATVFVWAQNQFSDSAGNNISYGYSENSTGPVEFVLSSVVTPAIQLTFNYSTRNTDITQSYSVGAMFEQTQRLDSVRSQGKSQNNTWANVRFYDLQYAGDAFGREILSSVQECASVSKTTCFPATTFDWQSTENDIGTALAADPNLLPDTPYAMQLADVNGDGLPDFLYTEKVDEDFYLKVKTANKNGSFSPWGSTSGYLLPKKQSNNLPEDILIIDVNADGYQDVIFLEYAPGPEIHSWEVMVSNGSGFATKAPLNNASGAAVARGGEQVLDFDGDGLSDLIQVRQGATPSSSSELIVHKNLYSAANGGAINFAEPVPVSINYKALFAANEGDGPYTETHDLIGLSGLNTPSGRAVYDYNGDGAVDILVKASRIYTVCSPPSCTISIASTVTGLSITKASFWIVLEANSSEAEGVWSYNYTFKDIIGKATDCTDVLVCGGSNAPVARDVWPVDINADGLADVVYLDDADGLTLSYRLNLGDGLADTVLHLYTLPSVDMETHLRFDDWNGDGYPDLIYPSELESQSATWMVLENAFGLGFPGGAMNTGKPAGNVSIHRDASLFVDFTGDGKRDHLFVDYNNEGKFDAATMRMGTNANQVNHVITSITNGLGAVTNISYKPLTDPSVYTRMNNSANADWGNGSVVYDLIAPMYVVSEASSSAPVSTPTSTDLNAMSAVKYHYAGAKIQAGGRGLLGFAEVVTYDPQSSVRTNTRYRQDFPFIGMPADTTQVLNPAEPLGLI
ncbi:MAG: FG-GAP-like repeat-containing protein, partial [Xanthomonadales bacterium]|nr:FG-GAP-like repeat-containing protein [Xanthomonadales bacterium]